MNLGDLFIQFQVEVENPSHLFQDGLVLYTRPSGIFAARQADTVQHPSRKALEAAEGQEQRNRKAHLNGRAIPDMQAGDLEDMGIHVGEVYDEKIIEEMLTQGAGSYSEES